MNRLTRLAFPLVVACLAAVSLPLRARAVVSLNPADMQWNNVGDAVQIHNLDAQPSAQAVGQVQSQALGLFVPDKGLIGQFVIPPLAPSSFFDVFFEVCLEDLPSTSQQNGATSGPIATAGRGAACALVACTPATNYNGKIAVSWTEGASSGSVHKHIRGLSRLEL